MAPKIFGFYASVFIVCKELDIPYEYVPVELGESKGEKWLTTMHPFGQVPVMVDDDGFRLYESRAIARYLARKYAPDSPLVPSADDLQSYGLFEQAMSIEAFNMSPPAEGLTKEKGFKPALGLPTDKQKVKEYEARLEIVLDVYDRILEKQKYLAGNILTYADLVHIMECAGLEIICGVNAMINPKRPNVERWFTDISSRPSWEEVKQEWLKYLSRYNL